MWKEESKMKGDVYQMKTACWIMSGRPFHVEPSHRIYFIEIAPSV